MAKLNVGLCAIVFAFAVCAANATPLSASSNQLGAKHCTFGPSYWCDNLRTAKECNAVRHCIQTVWEKQNVPQDDNEICKICKDMVTQARDQLRSNETQDELRQVFEGSCNLIPVKVVRKECIKLADDFVPELVEALTSQMNPDQVCSVAGLCNSAKINEMLKIYSSVLDGTFKTIETDSETVLKKLALEHDENAVPAAVEEHKVLSCGNCNQIAGFITDKLSQTSPDDLLENILRMCGQLSSYSDACSSIVLTYFNDIHEALSSNLNAKGLCHLSGTCAANYHQHPEDLQTQSTDEIVDLSMPTNDDIPCELCQQLVKHLRDVLVANTTEDEFKQVLHGLCGQMKSFKDECNSIVDQYYDVIYQNLVNNLDANGACFLIGVCPKGIDKQLSQAEIRPLLPTFPPAEIKVTLRKLGQNEPKFSNDEISKMQLPIDSLMLAANPDDLVDGGETCTLCEYALHFVQEYLADPKNEESVKHVVNDVCNYMPNTVHGACHDFIDRYSDMIIALVIQGIDPSQICPELHICPHHAENSDDVEVFSPAEMATDEQDKPTCPLCIFAVEEAQQKIKDNKSKENIINTLATLCNRLPSKLNAECVDFVHTYSGELIDKLISNFTPQEICVDLTLCENSNNYLSDLGISIDDESFDLTADKQSEEDGDDDDNDSNDFEANDELEESDEIEDQPSCIICEEVIKKAEKKLGPKPTKESVKIALNHACDRIKRKNLDAKCHEYVERYGDLIADLIIAQTSPKAICAKLGLCFSAIQDNFKIEYSPIESDESSDVNSPQCFLCKQMLNMLKKIIKRKENPDAIKRALGRVCHKFHGKSQGKCNHIVQKYGDRIAHLIIKGMQPRAICSIITLCFVEPIETETEEDFENEVSAENFSNLDSNEIDVTFALLDSPHPPSRENCTLCLTVVNKTESAVKRHANIRVIVQTLHSVCHNLTNQTQQRSCNKLVKRSAYFIAKGIKRGFRSHQICTKLHWCPRRHSEEDLEIDEALKYDVIAMPDAIDNNALLKNDRFTGNDDIINVQEPPNCFICKLAMIKLENLLRNHTEQQYIKHSLEKLCVHTPKTIEKRCTSFVEQYAVALIDLISKMPPEKICQHMSVCNVELQDVSIVADEVIECGVCHGISSYLVPYFRTHSELTSINGADMSSAACENVPAKYNDVCTEMVSIYGQSILNLAHKNYIDSAHVCAEIGKCFDNEKSALAFAAIKEDY